VFHAIEDGPAAGWGFARSEVVVDVGEGETESVAAVPEGESKACFSWSSMRSPVMVEKVLGRIAPLLRYCHGFGLLLHLE
jgi:hypothetical protein